jgi:hypothetical protein
MCALPFRYKAVLYCFMHNNVLGTYETNHHVGSLQIIYDVTAFYNLNLMMSKEM